MRRTPRRAPGVLKAGTTWPQASTLVDRLQAAEVELRLALVQDRGLALAAAGSPADAILLTRRVRLEVEVERERMAAFLGVRRSAG